MRDGGWPQLYNRCRRRGTTETSRAGRSVEINGLTLLFVGSPRGADLNVSAEIGARRRGDGGKGELRRRVVNRLSLWLSGSGDERRA